MSQIGDDIGTKMSQIGDDIGTKTSFLTTATISNLPPFLAWRDFEFAVFRSILATAS